MLCALYTQLPPNKSGHALLHEAGLGRYLYLDQEGKICSACAGSCRRYAGHCQHMQVTGLLDGQHTRAAAW